MPTRPRPMMYFGCSGWFYGHWEGLFYPERLPRNKWLEFYADRFNTVEINATFYRFPNPKMVEGWYNRTPKGFKFTLKGNRQITHVKRLRDSEELIERFYGTSEILREKLACILWQFPPSLKLDLERLALFCKHLDPRYLNVIEFRHDSWLRADVYEVLKKNGVGYCILSAPNLPEDVQVTSKIAYIRFHGKKRWYSHDYSQRELLEWANTIKNLKARDIYCYFNNDYNAYAVKNCLELKRILDPDVA